MEAQSKRPLVGMASSSVVSNVHGSSLNLKPNVARKESGAATPYVYEIDCKKVVDHVNVTDLVRL